MDKAAQLGRNRTGVQTSPLDTSRMKSGDIEFPLAENGSRGDLDVRMAYAAQADRLGSVPLPATLTGMAKSGIDMLTGKRPQVLMDKLGQRLAFERGGVRLYDTLLVKCHAVANDLEPKDVESLTLFRDQEAQHFELLAQALRDLGGDPTAQTPCADLAGIESQGLVQAMNDPRTSILQSLTVMLDAELIDNASWEMLIALARSSGHDGIADGFQVAMTQEAVHLQTLRELVERLTLKDAKVASAMA